jgi:hypothetical protein
MSFKRSFTSDSPGSERRSGLNRRWIKTPYYGIERRSGKDRRLDPPRDSSDDSPVVAERIAALEKLLLSTSLHLEALARLLVEKRILTHAELHEMLASIQEEYREKQLEDKS